MQRKLHYNETLGAFLLTYTTVSFRQAGWRLVVVSFPYNEIRMFLDCMREKYPGLRDLGVSGEIPSSQTITKEFMLYSEGEKWL